MKIGWIGTGVMGAAMAAHLQRDGHELFVNNRTREKASALLDRGAVWCDTPAAVAAAAEVVFTIVGFPDDVRGVYLGENGILDEGNPQYVVDMTTSLPSLAEEIAAAARARGIGSIDAPVSGGDVGAREGTLAIMCGGDADDFEAVRPLLEPLGKIIRRMGPPGAGQHTKMCNQILVSGTMIGVCESLLYAERQGLDQNEVIGIIGQGAAASWAINNLGPRIAEENFDPGFYVEHFVKDMGIALREAGALDLALPGLALVHQLYTAVKAQGHGRLGTQALMLALRQLNGIS